MLIACGNDGSPGAPPIDHMADAPIDVAPLPAGACRSTADCSTSRYCDWVGKDACGGADQAVGSCVPLGPSLCPDLGFWVCG
ncbi:MAG TPA: hypothetical protein VGO00_00740, partial [Kofleriaceae bacterium]|nr:hypothetical protein [Kofleriaceae bacterium]